MELNRYSKTHINPELISGQILSLGCLDRGKRVEYLLIDEAPNTSWQF